MKKMITAVIGGALFTGAMLGCGAGQCRCVCRPLPQAGSTGRAARHAPRTAFSTSPTGDEHHWAEGDRDGDGIACEKN